jgi:hypothetical protein
MNMALDELEQAFQEWRSTKKTSRERVPRELLERARGLAGQFSENEILRRCGLPKRRVFPKQKSKRPEFVEIPSEVVATPITVEIRSRDQLISVTLPASTDLGTLFSALTS